MSTLDPSLDVQRAVTKEQQQYALQLRHKLAMESVGLVRTCLNVQRPMFEALLRMERDGMEGVVEQDLQQKLLHSKSFDLQLRMAKACMNFLDELNVLANEAIELASKEKLNG
jgi:hypothetical protein